MIPSNKQCALIMTSNSKKLTSSEDHLHQTINLQDNYENSMLDFTGSLIMLHNIFGFIKTNSFLGMP